MNIEEMITAFHTCRQIKSYLFTGEKKYCYNLAVITNRRRKKYVKTQNKIS